MILFYDTETTGKCDPKKSYEDPCQPHLVQLAAIQIQEGGNVLGQINMIVKPDGWEISEEVSKIHGIKHSLAESVGIPYKVVLAAFNHMCRSSAVIVAHNEDFDNHVMRANYHRFGIPHRLDHLRHVCTMKAATDRVRIPSPYRKGQFKWPTLAETYAHYYDGATFDGAHNAMVDTLVLMKIFNRMAELGHISY